ncbi:ATP-binding protein [Solwaraspora sp. WMMB335]|uniref:ATP-binding protein n=1 Tax=Solwaraspora sp. WMMB335 TaxID=3404118 RepID=UPI003B949111
MSVARDEAFVGRHAELVAFQASLAGAPGAHPVWYVHGPGGIGKSMLLRRFAVEARAARRIVVQVDSAGIDPSPAGFTAAAYAALSGVPAVLLVDTFERCQGLEGWLRDRFLPQIPDAVVVVVAGRRPPDREWAADLGWSDVLRVVAVEDLPPDAATELLRRRGVVPELWDAVLRFAGGHPLALNLAAAVAVGDHAAATWTPTPDVVATLLHQLVGEVPSPLHRLALETCSHALTTNEDLLRAVVGGPAAELFAWLRQLPFVEADSDGVVPHDAVRSVLDTDLRWRDPHGYRMMHARVAAHLLDRARAASGDAVLPTVRSLYHILQDSAVMAPFALRRGSGAVYPDQARPDDHTELRSLARQADSGDELVGFWLERQPEAFDVYRWSRDGAIAGFQVTLRLTGPDAREVAADPVVAAAWAYVAAAPPRSGEHILLTRFGYPPADQRRSAVRDLMHIRTLQWWIRSQRLAWSFLTLAEEAVGIAEFIDHRPIRPRPIIDGRPYDLYGHDWRAVPVDLWARRVTAWPLAGPATPDATAPERTVLSQPEFDTAVRAALRHLHAPQELRRSPLMRSRMVAERSTGRGANADSPTVLRTLVAEAVDTLRQDPRDAKLHRVLLATYLAGPTTQEMAARLLGLPASTYKRHLRAAMDRVCELLWRRES